MLECINLCKESIKIRRSFIDKILFRSELTVLSRHCHYKCSLLNKTKRIKHNNKYPFRDFLGGHEFFSSFFSFLNLLSTVYSYRKFVKLNDKINRSTNQSLHFYYKINHLGFLINITTWCVATFYHYNVNYFTMILDYFFAFLNLGTNLYIFLIRILLEKRNFQMQNFQLITYFFIFYFLFHSYNLIFNFSFFMHKISCSMLVVLLIFTWFFVVRMNSARHNRFLLRFLIGSIVSSLVEISDIPPYSYLIDSHALYHLISAPGIVYYYKYIIYDIKKTFLRNDRKNK